MINTDCGDLSVTIMQWVISRASGAEQKYSLPKAEVKHDRAWSPNGMGPLRASLRPPRDFSGDRCCADLG